MVAKELSHPKLMPVFRSSMPMTYQIQANQWATTMQKLSIKKSSAKLDSKNRCSARATRPSLKSRMTQKVKEEKNFDKKESKTEYQSSDEIYPNANSIHYANMNLKLQKRKNVWCFKKPFQKSHFLTFPMFVQRIDFEKIKK